MPTTSELTDAMRLDGTVALDFYVRFGRFEFAMIVGGFGGTRAGGAVKPNWQALIRSLEQVPAADREAVIQAGQDLMAAPPKRLMLVNGFPEYVAVRRNGQSEIKFLVESVKRARNNLFHGGKFLTPLVAVDRNAFVVRESLRVIHSLLDVPGLHRVRRAFDSLPP